MMKLYFICACSIVFAICTITPTQALSKCSTPSKYSASFRALVSGTCNAKIKQWVLQNEGSTCKECMYLSSQGRKRIGFDFDLEETDVKAILAHYKADYDKIVNGAPTDPTMPCDCMAVTCLNQSQIEGIFDESIAQAIENTKRVLPSFESLCCVIQETIVDIAFALGKTTFLTYKQLFTWINYQNWHAAADFLTETKWCQVEDAERCMTDVDHIRFSSQGCPCFGQFSKQCFETASSCCKKGQSCCSASVTIKSDYQSKIRYEILCCEYQNATCCEGMNKCCPNGYQCCPPNNCCSNSDFCDTDTGTCQNPSGRPSQRVPADLIFPKTV